MADKIEKIEVEIAGDFMLIDVLGGQEITPGKTHKVNPTPFVRNAIAEKRLKIASEKAAPAPAPAPAKK